MAVVLAAAVGVAAVLAAAVVVVTVMAVAIGEGAEGAGYVMFAIGKSRRVFYVFLKASIANHYTLTHT